MLFFMIISLKTGRSKILDWVFAMDLQEHNSEHGVSSITTADPHTSTASSWLNWRTCRFKWTHPLRRKTKFGFCACVITFQTQYKTKIYLGIPFVPNFPGVSVLWGLKSSVLVYRKIRFGTPNVSGFCQVLKIRHLSIRTSILTFPRYKKTSVGEGQPSTSHYWEGTEEGEEGV
jgi:hypothetical protein